MTEVESDHSNPPRSKPSFVARWIRRAVWIGLVLGIILAAVPTLISNTSLGQTAVDEIGKRLPPGAEIGGLKLSWLSPVAVTDVAYSDGSGREVNVATVETGQSMFWMLWNQSAPTELTLRGVDVSVDLDRLSTAESREIEEDSSEPSEEKPRFDLPSVNIADLTLRLVNGPFAKPVVAVFDQVDITSQSDSNQINITTRGQLLEAAEGGQVQLTGEIDPDRAVARIGIQLDDFDGGELLQCLKSPPMIARGTADLQALVERKEADGEITGKIAIASPDMVLQATTDNSAPVAIEDFQLQAAGAFDPDQRSYEVSLFRIDSNLLLADLTASGTQGSAAQTDLTGRVELLGPAVDLAGLPEGLELSAVRFEPFQARVNQSGLSLGGSMHWPTASAFGLQSNSGRVDYRLTPTALDVALADVPIGDGRAVGTYRVDLVSTPPVLQFPGGTVLEQVTLTEDICRDWLKYISPTFANATDLRGRIGLELDPIDTPLVSGQLPEARGRVVIGRTSMRPGPMGRDLIGSIGGIGQLVGAERLAEQLGNGSGIELVDLPDQRVDFALLDGTVYHRGFTLESGKVTIATAGSVTLNDRVDIVARLSVDPAAFRGKPILAGVFGQPIDIPVAGSVDDPKIDRSAFKDFGRNAASGAIGGLLQKLLDKR